MIFLGLSQIFLSVVFVGVSACHGVFALRIALVRQLHLPRLETVSVDVTVAVSTECDQIFVCVVPQLAPRAKVVDLETIGSPAVLARQPSRSNTSMRSLR